ncbi:MAG: hypothetical protein H2172_00770 [Opitutus sp.]|nr:hypothetical protein [Opitutus sp.]MCS6246251.1 hypothetical protein [Opitutus sp.]MCS6274116.1 hypothetical protein [Opitutus sp.]MCS6277258.1 hypothetical protein [Opitutus sp.]MCS6300380.1 hypothetical protein [Opitutus sp.]
MIVAYACYGAIGGRYFYFEKGQVRQAKFDHLTGSLRYHDNSRVVSVRYDAQSSLWSGLKPEDEILVKEPSGEAVIINSALVINGRHRFTRMADPLAPREHYWVSIVDPTLIVRPQDKSYSWEKVSAQMAVKYGPEEDGWVTVEAP